MSTVINYFKDFFKSSNNRGKRKREFDTEESEEPIKYRRVPNNFPKTYTRPIDYEPDLFEEVKHQKKKYDVILHNFIMDQNRKYQKNIQDDGEYSDEDELNSYRVPVQQKTEKDTPFQFGAFFRNSQPSTSSSSLRQPEYRPTSSAFGEDNDVQFVSIARPNPPQQRSPRNHMPPLIPIGSSVSNYSQMLNGHSSHDVAENSSISAQPIRGRRSVLNLGTRFMAFNNSPPPPIPRKSVIYHNNNLEVKNRYDSLLKSLIPRFPSGITSRFTKSSQTKVLQQPVTTIDLSDDANESPPQQKGHASGYQRSNFNHRKSDVFGFKKPQAFVDLSDDDDQIANFSQNQILSSTILKSTDKRRSLDAAHFNQSKKSETSILPDVKPINSLQEKHANIRACQPNVIDSIVQKFHEARELKDQVIREEKKKAELFENERMQHERDNQKRIDESFIAALADKCIILDEEEDVVDEFPPLKDEQMRVVNFALHGPRHEIIVSKFKMDVTRYDFATLDGLNWLNDMVINFYLELIKERSEQVEYLPKVHVMNTVFLGKLLEQGYSSVRRWTRKVDIFSYDIIPVPVHVGGVHWCMSIIHMKNKTIKYYDSMGHQNYVVLDALEKYLKEESLDKRKTRFDTSDWEFECVRDCPQQKNGSDCGVFSCQFAEFISRDSSISFEQQHMPYIRRKMIFEIASGKLMLGF